MMRGIPAPVRHFFSALTLLALIVCAAELGLRVYDSYTGEFTGGTREDRGLLARSWVMHHRLKPLRRLTGRNPDSGAAVELATNSFGLRGPEIVVPKPPGVFRIVCLGDEAIFAAELPEPETFCVRLQEMLQSRTRLEIEVINAGTPGYCPLLSYLQVRHALLALQPDLLVLHFDMSDVADDHRYRRHTRMQGFEALACPHPELAVRRPRQGTALHERLLLVAWGQRQLGWLPSTAVEPEDRRDIATREGQYAWLKDKPPDWSVYIQQALSPLDSLNLLAGRMNAGLVVAAHPAPWQVSATASAGPGVRAAAGVPENEVYRSRAPFDLLAAYCDERGIPFCDVSPSFQQTPQAECLYLNNAPRLSMPGHQLYAREVALFLIQQFPGVWSDESGGPPPPRHAFSRQ